MIIRPPNPEASGAMCSGETDMTSERGKAREGRRERRWEIEGEIEKQRATDI